MLGSDIGFLLHARDPVGGLADGMGWWGPPKTDCFADLNDDGQVDGADLGLLLGSWNAKDHEADFNGDAIVDGADLGLLLGAWGPC